ncbi:uncharacterized protein LOC110811866 isoform X2 [Carica papaya]|uniref:uncharacterized protein LOC110811866 isoform X2 n=1 Tax=Carica papaya TaxID=3649 RepID=UPI000B8CD5CF|nr:uncharacterized protein LOC110811866 isoform X2 [Carica papaya]
MSFAVHLHLTNAATGTDLAKRRRRALERIDRELSKGNFKTALSLVKQLRCKRGGIRAFGTAKQVPKKLSSFDDLELSGTDLSVLRLLVDSVMDSVQSCSQFALLDEISSKGTQRLTNVEDREFSCEDYHYRCIQHEAGHFLVGYLLGVLPRGYNITSIEDLKRDNFGIARIEFVGLEFLKEGHRGKISSTNLNNFSCIILGGLVAEHILFGNSRGSRSDIDKLNRVLRWLGYTDIEAGVQVRWAVLNTAFILHHHNEARSKLAEAIALGKPVGFCIDAIENAISGEEC